ncbi:hypothetical protein OOJ09_18920 [Mesorhizobium qingshengii]|uniref:Uncharacterized protein n=1 Tax=Mesorhizobium qingshengii TaxID=1165689 RepID=A0ABT4QXF7_9HYPH|nr:hypothetical protein [Mesorhizobium qingshengii]MCZ8546266.1 hypothetical protein [Mesorhizobium qingshengii]
MAIHNQGTITVSNGSSIVIGDGTTWTSDMFGGQFMCAGMSEAILRVDGPGAIALGRPWAGDVITDAAYQIEYRNDRSPLVDAIKEAMGAIAPHIKVTQ